MHEVRRKGEQLRTAAFQGDVATVRALLSEKRNLDVDARDSGSGWSPLHAASFKGHAQVAELLLMANARADATDWKGWTPLHQASLNGHTQVVELLLKFNARVDAANEPGETALHQACRANNADVARLLLESGANLYAQDKDRCDPVCSLLKAREYSSVWSRTLDTLQVLVMFGATWDGACEAIMVAEEAWEEAPSLALCMSLWAQELADGLECTPIPIQVVKRGVESTQAYIDNFKSSRNIVLRRKICLVGPSCAGKTSLIKSIMTKKPQLEHVDDRTIGIDHFPLQFQRLDAGGNTVMIHEVTFWDFAGHDAYQVAHSLFFSPRALFIVCVDLEAFTVAFLQASIMSDLKKQETQLMGEFIDRTVMHWIRMVVTRQPDAEFVFVATKEDLLAENTVTERVLKKKLLVKLKGVKASMEVMQRKLKEYLLAENTCSERLLKSLGMVKLKDVEASTQEIRSKLRTKEISPSSEGASVSTNAPITLFVSCTSANAVELARTMIEDLICKSDRSFQMPETYTQALETIVAMRLGAKSNDISTRIDYVFAPVDTLPEKLKLEPQICHIILQTLDDLGDVLWYKDLGIELFQDRVILDPLLLIDFIRQVINHNYTGQTMPHTDLKALPYWNGLSDKEQMKAMKQVLQKFRLVYSANEDRTMSWDSDLIVPAYWQTKTPAAWLFLGDILRINETKSCEREAVRVHWEFHFEFGLPSSFFDDLVVASVSPYFIFDAGPDWILYEEKEIAACRIMVGRDPKSLHRTIHVEAVVAEIADKDQVEAMWSIFHELVGAFFSVMLDYRGLDASSFAWDRAKRKIGLDRLVNSSMNAPPMSAKWMPPTETWKPLKQIMLSPTNRYE